MFDDAMLPGALAVILGKIQCTDYLFMTKVPDSIPLSSPVLKSPDSSEPLLLRWVPPEAQTPRPLCSLRDLKTQSPPSAKAPEPVTSSPNASCFTLLHCGPAQPCSAPLAPPPLSFLFLPPVPRPAGLLMQVFGTTASCRSHPHLLEDRIQGLGVVLRLCSLGQSMHF